MATLSPKFLDVLRKHLEMGTSIQCLNMSDDQKQRTRIGMELYSLMKQNPYLDYVTYLKNKYNRTYWEIRHDKECLDFICSILDAGGKNISRHRVKATYEKAIQMAHDQGNVKEMISGAKHLSDLERLNEPEQGEDLENSITKLPIAFTDDARKVLPNKTHSNERQMDKIRAKWGVKKDVHQDMVDMKVKELLLSADGEEDGSPVSAGFDLSSLDRSQLEALQNALNARVMALQPSEEDDCEDDFEDED